jgi:hypothetical protein
LTTLIVLSRGSTVIESSEEGSSVVKVEEVPLSREPVSEEQGVGFTLSLVPAHGVKSPGVVLPGADTSACSGRVYVADQVYGAPNRGSGELDRQVAAVNLYG